MEPEIVFVPSAFKHGINKADIHWAFCTAKYDLPVEDDEGKRLLIGFNMAGNPLEIMYNRLDDETVKVFHAMKCRSAFYNLLNP
ncbi:MAG: hypothetical protein Pg6C_05300 [Treponemataceae bacterium]|nr:MAG: hypothetical protein Pg6C_05300 [Treponemataceae bacterium]